MSSVKGVKNDGETHLVEYTAPVGRSSAARFCGFLPGVVGHMSGPQGSRGLSPQVTGGLFFRFVLMLMLSQPFPPLMPRGHILSYLRKYAKQTKGVPPLETPRRKQRFYPVVKYVVRIR